MHEYPSYDREGLVERGWLEFWYDTQYVSYGCFKVHVKLNFSQVIWEGKE
jgi:hypothetical protein